MFIIQLVFLIIRMIISTMLAKIAIAMLPILVKTIMILGLLVLKVSLLMFILGVQIIWKLALGRTLNLVELYYKFLDCMLAWLIYDKTEHLILPASRRRFNALFSAILASLPLKLVAWVLFDRALGSFFKYVGFLTVMESGIRSLHEMEDLWNEAITVDVGSAKMEAVMATKATIVERLSKQGAPSKFRLIDVKTTCELNRVVLVMGHEHQDSYTAVSHTWGQAVYDVFDCMCSCECPSKVSRRSQTACPGAAGHGDNHGKVVKDILNMTKRLKEAGSEFVWHDGVCITQHDAVEVEETIKHMGWIYAHARDTVVFLDYVGSPTSLLNIRAVLRPPASNGLLTRWNSRVWTLQEAILSQRRRYCIRCVSIAPATDLSHDYIDNWRAFVAKVTQCFDDDSSISVIEEELFWKQIGSLYGDLLVLQKQAVALPEVDLLAKLLLPPFIATVTSWIVLMKDLLFAFPTLDQVLKDCALFRESKHKGDRINSVLGLAGITDYVAEKDGNLEKCAIEFLKKLGEQGLREAIFWVNTGKTDILWDRLSWMNGDEKFVPGAQPQVHSWLPSLSRPFFSPWSFPIFAKKPATEGSSSNQAVASTLEEQMVVCMAEEGVADNWPFSFPLQYDGSEEIAGPPCEDLIKYNVLENGMLELTGTLVCIPVRFNLVTGANGTIRSSPPNTKTLSINLVDHQSLTGVYSAFASHLEYNLGSAVLTSKNKRASSPAGVQQGDSFVAHLVLGQFHPREQIHSCRPFLIVLAKRSLDLQAPVSRLGFFLGYNRLFRVLFPSTTRAIILNRLVID